MKKRKPIKVGDVMGNWTVKARVGVYWYSVICRCGFERESIGHHELYRKASITDRQVYCNNCIPRDEQAQARRTSYKKKGSPLLSEQEVGVLTRKDIFGTKDYGRTL